MNTNPNPQSPPDQPEPRPSDQEIHDELPKEKREEIELILASEAVG